MFGGTQAATWQSCCVHSRGRCPGDYSAARTACLFVSRCRRSPSIGWVNCELCRRLPPSLRCSLLSLQSSKSRAAALPKHTGSRGELGFGWWFCMQPVRDCASQPAVRPLNPHAGLDLLFLFAALCPAYRVGVRGPPWHSTWFSERDSSHWMWT